jgi:tRNA (guanine37-N1)-methyltransferase
MRKMVFNKIGDIKKVQSVLNIDKSIKAEYGEIEVGYENVGVEEALKKLFANHKDEAVRKLAEEDVPKGFEVIGDIAHFNLKDRYMPVKHEIGQVFLDKNPHIKSIITKVGEIENEFRTYKYEFLAGEVRKDNLSTIHTEDEVKFHVDVKNMYWCSKL